MRMKRSERGRGGKRENKWRTDSNETLKKKNKKRLAKKKKKKKKKEKNFSKEAAREKKKDKKSEVRIRRKKNLLKSRDQAYEFGRKPISMYFFSSPTNKKKTITHNRARTHTYTHRYIHTNKQANKQTNKTRSKRVRHLVAPSQHSVANMSAHLWLLHKKHRQVVVEKDVFFIHSSIKHTFVNKLKPIFKINVSLCVSSCRTRDILFLLVI